MRQKSKYISPETDVIFVSDLCLDVFGNNSKRTRFGGAKKRNGSSDDEDEDKLPGFKTSAWDELPTFNKRIWGD